MRSRSRLNGWRVSGAGSSQRSQKTFSTSATAGPLIATWTSCHGGRSPYAPGIGAACGSPRCSASSRRLWHRSMPPTNATSRPGPRSWRRTTNFWWCEPPRRTRVSSSACPPAASMSSPRCRFSAELKRRKSRCERQISPRTRAPLSAARAIAAATSGPSGVRRSSGSPRQSENSSRSSLSRPASRAASSAK
ncbi:hypothetical protein ABT120_16500 [Nonomuraea angiospora]|uniref:hypothetical protein n=1 Tax=Nonomuraea angiospora TaxID=46172 RepID=UPI00332235F9